MWTRQEPLNVSRGLVAGLMIAALSFAAYTRNQAPSPAEMLGFLLVAAGPVLLVTLLAIRTNRNLRGDKNR